jgi:hypothetical protein
MPTLRPVTLPRLYLYHAHATNSSTRPPFATNSSTVTSASVLHHAPRGQQRKRFAEAESSAVLLGERVGRSRKDAGLRAEASRPVGFGLGFGAVLARVGGGLLGFCAVEEL